MKQTAGQTSFICGDVKIFTVYELSNVPLVKECGSLEIKFFSLAYWKRKNIKRYLSSDELFSSLKFWHNPVHWNSVNTFKIMAKHHLFASISFVLTAICKSDRITIVTVVTSFFFKLVMQEEWLPGFLKWRQNWTWSPFNCSRNVARVQA